MARELRLPATTEQTFWAARALTAQTHSFSSLFPIPNWPSSPEPHEIMALGLEAISGTQKWKASSLPCLCYVCCYCGEWLSAWWRKLGNWKLILPGCVWEYWKNDGVLPVLAHRFLEIILYFWKRRRGNLVKKTTRSTTIFLGSCLAVSNHFLQMDHFGKLWIFCFHKIQGVNYLWYCKYKYIYFLFYS